MGQQLTSHIKMGFGKIEMEIRILFTTHIPYAIYPCMQILHIHITDMLTTARITIPPICAKCRPIYRLHRSRERQRIQFVATTKSVIIYHFQVLRKDNRMQFFTSIEQCRSYPGHCIRKYDVCQQISTDIQIRIRSSHMVIPLRKTIGIEPRCYIPYLNTPNTVACTFSPILIFMRLTKYTPINRLHRAWEKKRFQPSTPLKSTITNLSNSFRKR